MTVAVRHRTHAPPRDLPGEAQPVQPQGIVFAKPGGKHVRLPRARGHFVSVQQVQDGRESFGTLGAGVGRDALPAQQEPHEVGGRNRLDFLTEAIERVAVDPGQEPALAPFELRHTG